MSQKFGNRFDISEVRIIVVSTKNCLEAVPAIHFFCFLSHLIKRIPYTSSHTSTYFCFIWLGCDHAIHWFKQTSKTSQFLLFMVKADSAQAAHFFEKSIKLLKQCSRKFENVWISRKGIWSCGFFFCVYRLIKLYP